VLERRAAERLKIQAVVDLRFGEHSERVMAYDLSTDGCMLEADKAALHADADVALTFPNGVSASGRVVWTKHRNTGVQFAEPMPFSAVARIAKGRPRPEPKDRSSAQISNASEHDSTRGYALAQLDANPSSPIRGEDAAAASSLLSQQKIVSIFHGTASAVLIAYCAALWLYS
jgi:hypothetical protein